ncbi:DEAD-box ATP-dependent RNA helicase 21 [Acorus calamus]|uniref:DEAD-box ATP-dependent RNA helicase 21 n=1 Tax=Acorus calamus TaxID=4465 RepID=A0AAV9DRT8_ACOCL|nr:DEAD-box ATP-dependent RNA helicase 21 [Acorus calamus]
MRSWPESGLRPKLINAVDPFGDRDPLPIQMVAVPLGVQQRDLIALCAPVPGKITAYLLPMLQHICHCSRLDREACSHPLAVIVVPNRQLAEKVARVMERLSRYMVDVKVSLILDEGDALNKLGRGSHVIVGTVDQLGKCIERSTLVMRQSCGYLIMDEADYMVEMGFDKELEAMLKAMPRRRTIHVYTETMPTSLEKLTRRHLHDPINVAVDREVSKALEQRASEKKDLQMVAVPLGVQQRDLVSLCAPVPGKITAYLLPMLQHICHCSRLDREACSHPLAVIVVPNRQLAEKVARVMERLSRYMVDVKVSLILDEGDTLNKLGRGSHVIVGTVDQLGKCVERSTLVMRQSCGYLIMDEADYMVEMGFDKELEAMLKAMPRRRTIHVYTETMPTSLEKLTRRHLHDPINVAVDREVSKALEERASEKKVQMLKKRAAAKLLFH